VGQVGNLRPIGNRPVFVERTACSPTVSAARDVPEGTVCRSCERASFALTPIFAVTLIPVMRQNPAGFPRLRLAGISSHRLYLNENNDKIPDALFAVLYNGFRDSCFTRMCRLRHSRRAPIYSCVGFLRPRLVFTLPFAAPPIFDNCIKSTSPGGQADQLVGRPVARPPASLAAARATASPRPKAAVYTDNSLSFQ
jgi:hypothetical protein